MVAFDLQAYTKLDKKALFLSTDAKHASISQNSRNCILNNWQLKFMFLLILLQNKKHRLTLSVDFMALSVVPICVCAGDSRVISTRIHTTLAAEIHDGWLCF